MSIDEKLFSDFVEVLKKDDRKFDIEKIEWMDNGEELSFNQNPDRSLTVNFTPQPYGTDLCVRIAKATLK